MYTVIGIMVLILLVVLKTAITMKYALRLVNVNAILVIMEVIAHQNIVKIIVQVVKMESAMHLLEVYIF